MRTRIMQYVTRLSWQSLTLFCVGYAPICALCIALLGFVPLHLGAMFLVLPALIVGVGVGVREPRWGRLALVGLAAGILATGVYDALRLGLVWLGLWRDFIPEIGRMALGNDQAHPAWGYLWRFVGNGGCLGLAFAVLPWRGARAGVIYGTLICGCLFLTIGLSPDAAERLFALSPVTMTGALVGHWIYGSVLGWLTASWIPWDPGASRGTPSDWMMARAALAGDRP